MLQKPLRLVYFVSTLLTITGRVSSIDISSLDPAQVLNSLGIGSNSRTINVGGLLTGGFDKLGYVPISEALQRCEGSARGKVENFINRFRAQGESLFKEISQDLEARCRSYIEYAGTDCQNRIESLASSLERSGRDLLTDAQERCGEETMRTLERTRKEEEERYSALGKLEEQRLMAFYTDLGAKEEVKIRKEFEERGKKLQTEVQAQYEARGQKERERIEQTTRLRGEVIAAKTEIELRKRGEILMRELMQEYEMRGMEVSNRTRAELMERGDRKRKEIEDDFAERGRKLREEGEMKCTDMIKEACADVVELSESDDFCLDFFFFTGSEEERRRLRRKRKRY